MFDPPYETVLKPYGQALLALARRNTKVICLGADLTRQTETDMFRDAIGERFFNVGAAEANMIVIAGGLARAGHIVFVSTFSVFCTPRCFDQIAWRSPTQAEHQDHRLHAWMSRPEGRAIRRSTTLRRCARCRT